MVVHPLAVESALGRARDAAAFATATSRSRASLARLSQLSGQLADACAAYEAEPSREVAFRAIAAANALVAFVGRAE